MVVRDYLYRIQHWEFINAMIVKANLSGFIKTRMFM